MLIMKLWIRSSAYSINKNDMKLTEQKNVKKVFVTETVCDICGLRNKGDDWSNGTFKVSETDVFYRHGELYPEGGSTTTKKADICPTCFTEKLVPALEALGCKFREEECDY